MYTIAKFMLWLERMLGWDAVASTDFSITEVPLITPTMPPHASKTPSTATFPPRIELWAQAIAIGEGARPELCNEGNLKVSSLTRSWGATPGRQASDGGWLCKFPTMEAGHTALCNFLLLAAEGQLIISHPRPCSLQAFTVKYAGNPPQEYINKIAATLGVSPQIDIATFLT